MMKAFLKKTILCGAMGALTMVGCTTEDSLNASSGSDKAVSSPKQSGESKYSARTSGATTYFQSYSEIQTDGHPSTEKFADCGTDQVMTGWGGWVSSGDFKAVTVYCRSIAPNGTLGSETTVFNGSSGIQVSVHAASGWVVAGVGGWVRSSLRRATIFQCQWNPATKSIDANSCAWFGSDNNAQSEMQYDVRANQPNASSWPKIIATGAGFTASDDNVSEIRLTSGTLK
jgi:hypothetical protein